VIDRTFHRECSRKDIVPDRVLITGGAGFIGACLARTLIETGHSVSLLLRRSSDPWRLAGLEGRYQALVADLCDPIAVHRAVNGCRPEVIYHAASHGAFPAQNDRASILTSNILGTAHLLDALEARDYRVFVNVGTSSEYGHKPHPMRGEDRLEPRTDYAVSKAAATQLCMAEAMKGRPVTTVRIFTAYGPWDDPTRLIPYVMGCCLRGENPKVTAGRQPRDFVYVDDIVELLQTAAMHPNALGRILHAGSSRSHTVREIVDLIVSTCGKGRVRAIYGAQALRCNEPSEWEADIRDTTRQVGWRPRYSLQEGVERLWQWCLARGVSRAA
jgi:nucleoside-diphosphate-sugar epimerase